MKKRMFLNVQSCVVLASLLSGVASVNACSPSTDLCPEVAALPSIGPSMCNLCADRVKVKETVDTCNLLVQGDAYVIGDLRVDGNICSGSEPSEGSEVEEGILIITSKQFRAVSFGGPPSEITLFPFITPCEFPLFDLPVTVGFPIPADFDKDSTKPIEIDVHFIGPLDSGGIEVVYAVASLLRITHDGDIVQFLVEGAPVDISFLEKRYQIEPSFVVLPSGAGNLPGDLIRFGLCLDDMGSLFDIDEVPRLAAITVRYPKIV